MNLARIIRRSCGAAPGSRPGRRRQLPTRPPRQPARKRPAAGSASQAHSSTLSRAHPRPRRNSWRRCTEHTSSTRGTGARTLRVGVLGAVPASVLALRSARRHDQPLRLAHRRHRAGGRATGTTSSAAPSRAPPAIERDPTRAGSPSSPSPTCTHQGDTGLRHRLGRPRRQTPGVPFELTAHDTAHLIVTRGEHSYEVGPLVIPGITPCYQCVEHARAAADPFRLTHLRELADWPLGTLPLLAHYAAALRVARLVRDFVSGALTASLCAEVATIDEDGKNQRRTRPPRPRMRVRDSRARLLSQASSSTTTSSPRTRARTGAAKRCTLTSPIPRITLSCVVFFGIATAMSRSV